MEKMRCQLRKDLDISIVNGPPAGSRAEQTRWAWRYWNLLLKVYDGLWNLVRRGERMFSCVLRKGADAHACGDRDVFGARVRSHVGPEKSSRRNNLRWMFPAGLIPQAFYTAA